MIRFVTSNEGKVRGLASVLEPYYIGVEQIALDLFEPQTYDIESIAIEKAKDAYARIGLSVLVQDSGFELDAWPGFPGAFAKGINDTIGNPGILKLLDGCERGCQFRTVWAYTDGSDVQTYATIERGQVAPTERGSMSADSLSPLWRIYIPEHEANPNGLTLAEMDAEALANHRSTAYKAELARWIVGVSEKKKTVF